MLKSIKTILGTRARTNYARGAIVAIYKFSDWDLNLDRLLVSVMFLSSFFHKKGPKYLRECLPYNTELNLRISKFCFLKLYLQDLVLKMQQMTSAN